jgi:hypothetical protein
MEVLKMFGVFDAGVDGRAPSVLKAVYHTENEAAQRAGAYRHVSPVWMAGPTPANLWYVLERPHPVAVGVDFEAQRNEARKAALAKLTPADRVALGLE